MTDQAGPAIALLEVPMRLGSISGGRFDLAPQAIKQAAYEYIARRPDEPGRITQMGVLVEDHDDIDGVADMRPEHAFDRIYRGVAVAFDDDIGWIRSSRAVAILGGDNSITRPGLHGIALGKLDSTALLTFDAHHDVRETTQGLTNGNPVRALLEDGLPGENVMQVGIQALANGPGSAAFARDAGVTVVLAHEVRTRGMEAVVAEALRALGERADGIYVDLDIDVLDRAFAPACPGSRPGGLTPSELQIAARLCGEHPKVRAIDIVEVDPERDIADVTVLTAASCLLAFAAGLAGRPS